MTQPDRRGRAQTIAGIALAISALGSIGFALTTVSGNSLELEGLALGCAFAGLAIAFVMWGKRLVPQAELDEARGRLESTSAERSGATAAFARGSDEIARPGFLQRMLFATLGVLGVAALFPVRALGPNPNPDLFKTKWTPGARLVRSDGTPVRNGDLDVGSVTTVFPDGFVGSEDSQTLLLRLPPDTLRAPPERAGWSPAGYVAYSKICTHAGCPVGLFRADLLQLLCPCHQSVFDVVNQARPISGPATQPLPQLPIRIADDGYLHAQSDYRSPVGPGFWVQS